MYELVADHSPAVCATMLDALNREYRPPRPWRQEEVDLLLHNDLEIPSEQDRYEWVHEGRRTEIDLKVRSADLNHDGSMDFILEWRGSLGGFLKSSFLVTPTFDPDRTSEGAITDEYAKALLKNSLRLTFASAYDSAIRDLPKADETSTGPNLSSVIGTVVLIDEDAFMLVSGFQPQYSGNYVFLLRSNSAWEWSAVCAMRHLLEHGEEYVE